MSTKKTRLLSGDTTTGRLHLGHWVGSLENRIAMQDHYDCYFVFANMHAFTTRVTEPAMIQRSTLDIALDYLAAGIDPERCTVFVESEVPAIYELAVVLSMLVPFPRVMRNPTIKAEIRDKALGDHYSMGFLLYPILQVADILALRASLVPVGEDQLPHLELTREVARRFNQVYCGVDSHTLDDKHRQAGGLFDIPMAKIGRVGRLVGLGPPGKDGALLKMSKSLNNAILLSDSPDIVQEKIMSMYTDPNRIRATDPGRIENNPLWMLIDTFVQDEPWIIEAKDRYRNGKIGDVACKKKLLEYVLPFLAPMYERHLRFKEDAAYIKKILREGAAVANSIADDTLKRVKEQIKQVY